ncbi:hypothetical protein K8R47_00850 [archaeon]|nr:hypothetical protein [archaeon]
MKKIIIISLILMLGFITFVSADTYPTMVKLHVDELRSYGYEGSNCNYNMGHNLGGVFLVGYPEKPITLDIKDSSNNILHSTNHITNIVDQTGLYISSSSLTNNYYVGPVTLNQGDNYKLELQTGLVCCIHDTEASFRLLPKSCWGECTSTPTSNAKTVSDQDLLNGISNTRGTCDEPSTQNIAVKPGLSSPGTITFGDVDEEAITFVAP